MTVDVQIVQRGIIGKGNGYDHYILSNYWVDDAAEITISDSGSNNVQLIHDLEISSSLVAQNAVMLTLSNGAEITILDAANYDFTVGGNPLTGEEGTKLSYDKFVSDVLGVDMPLSGIATGEAVTLGPETVSNRIILEADELAIGTDSPDTFVVDVSNGGNFSISGVDALSDSIEIAGISGWPALSLQDLVGQSGLNDQPILLQENPFDGSVLLNLGVDESGDMVSLKIEGISREEAYGIALKSWDVDADISVYGTSSDDEDLRGTLGNDVVAPLSGKDNVYTLAGSDTVYLGSGTKYIDLGLDNASDKLVVLLAAVDSTSTAVNFSYSNEDFIEFSGALYDGFDASELITASNFDDFTGNVIFQTAIASLGQDGVFAYMFNAPIGAFGSQSALNFRTAEDAQVLDYLVAALEDTSSGDNSLGLLSGAETPVEQAVDGARLLLSFADSYGNVAWCKYEETGSDATFDQELTLLLVTSMTTEPEYFGEMTLPGGGDIA